MADADAHDEHDAQQPATKRRKPNPPPKKARVNTAVYITGLPLDATAEEVGGVFSKCGVIAEEIDSGDLRIKMYENDEGEFKGDALVVYFRPESVLLAVQMLDETELRLGGGTGMRMRVQAAEYEYKKVKDSGGGEDVGKVVEGKGGKVARSKDQQKIIRKTQKLNSKLTDWDDDDPATLQDTSSKWDKTVILKHMFTLEELEEDPAAILEIKEDIRDECEKLGEVTNVVLFDKEPEGVARVRFTDARAAEACVKVMNGRWFEARQVKAYIAQGPEKFKKSDDKKGLFDDDENGEDGEGGRLEKFGEWLEEEETKKTAADDEKS